MVERKRRRAASLVAEGSEVRTHQHFLSAAIDVEGRSGGLTVFWKDSSKCRVLNYTRNFINMLVEDEQWGEWRLTCYYGYPERSRRRAAWDLLRVLGNMSSIPWCIIGDFNDLLSQADKKGIHPHPNGLCMGFRQAVSDCDLTDIPIEGHPFTWIKSRGTPHVIEERLDRAMVSSSWLQLFPQNSWLKEPDLEDVVVEDWGEERIWRRMNELRGNQDEEGSMQYQELSERHATLLIQEESKKKKVTKLIADNGTEAHTQEELCQVAKSYFDTLFKPRDGDHDPQALFQMHPDKSSGPDGFNPAFYQRFWEQCSDDIFSAASTWLERGYFPTSLNETNICLIPKCDNPTSMRDLRPISLCNVLYKMISKVLANRLKCCLDKCVSQEQSAFVEGRSILDNALIATEVIHALKRKTKGRRGELALKIDISKTYDKVDCGFLRGVMTKMGFTDVWIRWVMMCVSSVNYSVLMNSDRVGPILPGRGLRQGDPLSPYLFILVTECLTALIHQAVGRGDLHGVKICRGAPEVSHLLFADNCFLFCRANVAEVNELMRILHTYETTSGQEVNLVKSEVFISQNMSQEAKEDLSRILGVKLVLGTSIYLGLPSMVGRSKEIMIKSVLQAIPSYDAAEKILETLLVSSVCEDKVVWEEERNECYSVKSGGCLPTRSRLLERRVECTLNCPVCDEETEDELHIFFRCVVARDSWSAAGMSSVLHNATYQQTNAMDRISAVCSNESSDTVGRVAMLLTISNNVSGTTAADLVRWEKPTLDWVKCNVDVAFVTGSERTSVGLCFRDNSGHFMAGMTQWQQTVISSVEGEAWALLLAMEEARHRGLDRVQFESDSKVLIEAIHMKRRGNSEFLSIVHDILSLMSSFINFEVKFVRRQANLVAHTLARAANFWADFHRF
ncbi:hypothetical protein TSUD_360370 [Trifolium subterraneum]|uniref:Reverse transcriptase domain-containing protein n=1 Tax=Trifolium subterraneum TaxID=3900 RepID=A0A2Z6MBW8_TRISU|nr:hypothetical protein TSUD_360370 [Trifolium subterraneum]